ncbi:hypothetical protein ACNHKD_14080 [Methylocystis sp. JAN1]|uniref:hypothetical protein n=1 Tax=Methylocystis sp. JAN1 TaxID=3397211 RepID=UPI003FA27D3A
MRPNFKKTISAAALVGVLGAGFASPAAADGWGRRGWGYGYHGGWNNGGAAAAAAIGGFALGAMAGAASQPGYGYGYGYGNCYYVDRPVTDDWGNVVAYRRAQVCE